MGKGGAGRKQATLAPAMLVKVNGVRYVPVPTQKVYERGNEERLLPALKPVSCCCLKPSRCKTKTAAKPNNRNKAPRAHARSTRGARARARATAKMVVGVGVRRGGVFFREMAARPPSCPSAGALAARLVQRPQTRRPQTNPPPLEGPIVERRCRRRRRSTPSYATWNEQYIMKKIESMIIMLLNQSVMMREPARVVFGNNSVVG